MRRRVCASCAGGDGAAGVEVEAAAVDAGRVLKSRFYSPDVSAPCCTSGAGGGGYLVVRQPHPWHEVLRDREDIAQDIDLEPIEAPIDGALEEGFERVDALLELLGLGVAVELGAVAVCVADCARWGEEAETGGRGGEEVGFNRRDRVVEELVGGVDDVVDDCEGRAAEVLGEEGGAGGGGGHWRRWRAVSQWARGGRA